MLIELFNKKQTDPLIDAREAFNLWDVLNSKYMVMDKMIIYENYAHDKDLKLIIQTLYKPLQKNIRILEKEMEKYAIKSPDRNRASAHTPENPQVLTDEYIALDMFVYFQEHIENLLKVFRSCVTNESVREIIKDMTKRTVFETNAIIYYLRNKGWLAKPPIYTNLPQGVTEELSLGEAADLWDHLTYRYDNIHITEIFLSFAHDIDFKLILGIGLKQLQNQIGILEKELNYFGIPLPKRPGKFTLHW